MRRLVMATGNAHKVAEVVSALGSLCEVVSAVEAGINGEIPEDQATLEENAQQKAEYVWGQVGGCVFADDTGLEVNALGGAPGAFSARYAGPECSFEDNIRKLLEALEGTEDRGARFRTVIWLILDGSHYQFEGVVEGEILRERSGTGGFGYDPIFRPCGSSLSFAEMDTEVKNALSHRGRAVRALASFLAKRWGGVGGLGGV